MQQPHDGDLIAQHNDWLVERAKEALKDRPDLRMVAVIMEENAPEALSILQSKADIHRVEGGSFSLLLTRFGQGVPEAGVA